VIFIVKQWEILSDLKQELNMKWHQMELHTGKHFLVPKPHAVSENRRGGKTPQFPQKHFVDECLASSPFVVP
jgi:hypothetical protein